jgi:hypothetical protein
MSDDTGALTDPEPILHLRGDELDWLPVDDDVVVLDGRRAIYLATNGSGARLWRALSQGATRSDLVDVLIEAFRIDPQRATADVEAFLAALVEHDLLDST